MKGYRSPFVKRSFPARTVGVSLAVFLLLAVTACSGCKGSEETLPSPREESASEIAPIPGLSPDQSRVVSQYGYPDHFFISIDPHTRVRVEKWIYYSLGKSLDFDEGRLFGEEAVEDKSAEYPPTTLRPQDFDSLLTPEEASSLLGDPLFVHEVEESLLPENTFIVYEKAVLLYRNGQLIGVDTQVHPPEVGSELRL